jgi:hypothetical protein
MAGTQRPGEVARTEPAPRGESTRGGRHAPDVRPRGVPDPSGDSAVDPVGGTGGKRKRSQSGFQVDYKNLGKDEDRSRYDSTAVTILINLDHPLVTAALGNGNVEDTTFRRLSYEIAFSEYAMALGYEISHQDPNIPADDLLYDIRATLNRLSKAAVALYR